MNENEKGKEMCVCQEVQGDIFDPIFETKNKDVHLNLEFLDSLKDAELFSEYGNAYLNAARLVGSEVLESGTPRVSDLWYFPMMFFYRSTIELLIKSIMITNGIKTLDVAKEVSHNLNKGWERVKKIIKSKIDKKDFAKITKIVQNFQKVDSTADKFRYPVYDKKSIFAKQTSVNIFETIKTMEFVIEQLSKIIQVDNVEFVGHDNSVSSEVINKGNDAGLDSTIFGQRHNKELVTNSAAFKEVGHYLLNEYLTNKLNNKNEALLMLPIFFSFKLAIELSLKDIIDRFEGHNADFEIQEEYKTHSLGELWEKFVKILDTHSIGQDKNINEMAAQINALDSDGYLFRYPFGKVDKQLPEPNFNVTKVASQMTDIINYLDYTSSEPLENWSTGNSIYAN